MSNGEISKCRWLVISYFANLPGACQAEWVEDRMAALSDLEGEIQLLSSYCGGRHSTFRNIQAHSLFPADIRYEMEFIFNRTSLSAPWRKFWQFLIFLPLYPFYWIETKVLNIYGESRWSWLPLACILGLLNSLWRRPTVIYSTGGPASAHVVAAFISKSLNIPWMAELQDPIVGEDIGRNKFAKLGLALIEKFIFRFADKVIFCTQAARDEAISRHGSGKASCIYPGSSVPQKSPQNIDGGSFCRFLYLGSLYSSRNMDKFMVALRNLFAEQPQLRHQFRLDMFGHVSPDIRKRILDFEYDVLKMNGLVPRSKAFQLAREADVLILIQNTDDRSSTTIPFKTYDYLRLGKKILGLTFKNEELQSLLRKHGHISVSANDEVEIQEAISHTLNLWRLGKLQDTVLACELTPARAANQMLELCHSLVVRPSSSLRDVKESERTRI